MDIKGFAKTCAKDTAQVVIPPLFIAGVAALVSPLFGAPVIAGAAFCGATFFTLQATSLIAMKILGATSLEQKHPIAYKVIALASSIPCCLLGLAAGVGVTTALGLSLAFGTSVGILAVSALALFVTAVVCVLFVKATMNVVAYATQ